MEKSKDNFRSLIALTYHAVMLAAKVFSIMIGVYINTEMLFYGRYIRMYRNI